MSSLVSPVRNRVQRTATTAVERARLSLVPAARSRAPKAPFAVLVLAVLAVGVVGLLVFNTHMQQDSFYATKLQQKADDLTAQQQKLNMELEELRDPQRLAEAAKQMHLVAPPNPAFISLADGRISGVPQVATSGDGVIVNPPPARLPPALVPPAKIVHVVLPAKTETTKPNGNGPASTKPGAGTGTNDPTTTAQGANR